MTCTMRFMNSTYSQWILIRYHIWWLCAEHTSYPFICFECIACFARCEQGYCYHSCQLFLIESTLNLTEHAMDPSKKNAYIFVVAKWSPVRWQQMQQQLSNVPLFFFHSYSFIAIFCDYIWCVRLKCFDFKHRFYVICAKINKYISTRRNILCSKGVHIYIFIYGFTDSPLLCQYSISNTQFLFFLSFMFRMRALKRRMRYVVCFLLAVHCNLRGGFQLNRAYRD